MSEWRVLVDYGGADGDDGEAPALVEVFEFAGYREALAFAREHTSQLAAAWCVAELVDYAGRVVWSGAPGSSSEECAGAGYLPEGLYHWDEDCGFRRARCV
jgi:hypothetical protein